MKLRKPRRTCQLLQVTRSPVGDEYHDQLFKVTCQSEGVQAGSLTAWRRSESGETVMSVRDIGVNRRRHGIGTQLYEKAAEVACEEFGLPLASDRSTSRSKMSEGFWKKQLKKKRARCIGESGSKRCYMAVLSCPAPVSLDGTRRRRR